MSKSYRETEWAGISAQAKLLIHDKTIDDIKYWIATHGVDRGTAAQIFGYIAAYDIELGPVQLCNYGIPYSFAEFMEWMRTPKSNDEPIVNEICVFWDEFSRGSIIAVLTEVKTSEETDAECETPITKSTFIDNFGKEWKNCKIFSTFAEYRHHLNSETIEEKRKSIAQEEEKRAMISKKPSKKKNKHLS